MIAFLAHFLLLLAAWTLTIKFAFPIAFAIWEGAYPLSHIYWDFWWVAHLWLAWALLNWQRYTYTLAMAVSVVEIGIIVTKFWLFLSNPVWDIWNTNWFINKIFVLACFVLMFGYFARHRHRLMAAPPL
mgnify:CR=1 FL=1